MSINELYHTVLDYPIAFGSIIDENIKSLCCLLWIFEIRIAITIITDQHQYHDCEEDITISDVIEIITQLYKEYNYHRLIYSILLFSTEVQHYYSTTKYCNSIGFTFIKLLLGMYRGVKIRCHSFSHQFHMHYSCKCAFKTKYLLSNGIVLKMSQIIIIHNIHPQNLNYIPKQLCVQSSILNTHLFYNEIQQG